VSTTVERFIPPDGFDGSPGHRIAMGDTGVVSTLNVVSEGGFWGIMLNPPVENFPEDRGNGKKTTSEFSEFGNFG
jgi:hypothetical protein